MTAVIADTHTIIWYLREPNRLSELALLSLDNAIKGGNLIHVSAISVIEVTFLVEKNRLPQVALERLITELSHPETGFNIIPIDLDIAESMQQIPRQLVPEMRDRIIAATALYLQLPLITRDLKIQSLSNIQTIW